MYQMTEKRHSLMRQNLMRYLEFSYAGWEKNAFDALFNETPFDPETWKKLYYIFRNSREALMELYVLLCPFLPQDTYIAGFDLKIKEDCKNGSIENSSRLGYSNRFCIRYTASI